MEVITAHCRQWVTDDFDQSCLSRTVWGHKQVRLDQITPIFNTTGVRHIEYVPDT